MARPCTLAIEIVRALLPQPTVRGRGRVWGRRVRLGARFRVLVRFRVRFRVRRVRILTLL